MIRASFLLNHVVYSACVVNITGTLTIHSSCDSDGTACCAELLLFCLTYRQSSVLDRFEPVPILLTLAPGVVLGQSPGVVKEGADADITVYAFPPTSHPCVLVRPAPRLHVNVTPRPLPCTVIVPLLVCTPEHERSKKPRWWDRGIGRGGRLIRISVLS